MKKKLFIVLPLLVSALAGCGKDTWKPLPEDVKTITIGATPSPHAEILKIAKNELSEQGYTLNIREFNDYIIPNTAVEEGELDANFFQHITYLNDFNATRNTHLVSVGKVHYEPFAIYAGNKDSLENVSNGDKVLVPNDATNEARALLLLEEAGLITLKKDAGITATKKDIETNPYNLNIVELDAAQIPSVRNDGAYAVINGNYAISNGLSLSDALKIESAKGVAAEAYANVLCVRDGNQNNKAIKALYASLTGNAVKDYINKTYGGAVVAL